MPPWRWGTQSSMAIHLYADSSRRVVRQICGDATAVLALMICVWIGISVHDVTAHLAGPGRTLETAGAGLADRMSDAEDAASSLPVVGDSLSAPFAGAGDASRGIEAAGVQEQDAVAKFAVALGWMAGGVPGGAILAVWLSLRFRFARRAGEAAELRAADGGQDLLALRALTGQPTRKLLKIHSDVVTGWRVQDREVIARLAALELEELGLRGSAGR